MINHSKNASGADNQQERPGIKGWIVGFTDGEGCFSVSIFRNKTTKLGWQIFPEFVITQSEKSLDALELFRKYFDCGRIFVNKRYDNHNENLYRFCVHSIQDLHEKIIPFFKKNKLRTHKQKDFKIFSEIVEKMMKKKHLTSKGMMGIAQRIKTMNRKNPSKFLESSETIRQASAKPKKI